MTTDKPRRLGRGLEALLSQNVDRGGTPSGDQVQRVALAKVRPNPFQPRRQFAPGELADLEASIRASGLLQPITVRRAGDEFELIAGERRLRAVTNIGWKEIPAIVRDADDRTMLTLALVENLQRADLNCVDEALGYQRLLDEFGLTQQQIADAVGKDRSTVANLLRLLGLPPAVRTFLEQGALSMGHARALLGLRDDAQRTALANEAVAKGLSVRDLEHRVRTAAEPAPAPIAAAAPRAPGPQRADTPAAVRGIEDRLRRHFQTDVSISVTGGERGTVRIAFYSNEDLDRVLDLILGTNRTDFD